MSKSLIIDTKFARRDVQRMKTAIDELNAVKNQYRKAADNLNTLYKGNASEHLQNHLINYKIKKIDDIIKRLDSASNNLNKTIKKVEEENRKLTNIMKS